MRIYIITMDDPIQTFDFIKNILDARKDNVVGLAIPKGDRLTISKGKSKFTYLLSLLLILGPIEFTSSALTSVWFKIRKYLSKQGIGSSPSIGEYAISLGIPVKEIKTPNGKKFREYLNELDLDIIINQSQNIIRKELLSIPKIGVLNRHNALLPKNRGRLTPFWVCLNREEKTGVSIHFVEEGIDSGDIVVQREFKVEPNDSFNTIVKKNYEIASDAMLEALDLLEGGTDKLIYNDDTKATYNTTPTLKEAWRYRLQRWGIS
jgi:folate-dependent phosphoribosylglycinamide formyltransferase PurN